jgi:hypothetical protein
VGIVTKANKLYCEFSPPTSNFSHIWQLKNKETASKGSHDGRGGGGRAKFAENLCASPFNKDLSNQTTFSLIHLGGQYLKKCLPAPKKNYGPLESFTIQGALNGAPSCF